MSDERTKITAMLDSCALGLVTAGVMVFGVIALSVAVHLVRVYPGAAAAFGSTLAFGFGLCFVWALVRVMRRYHQ